MIENMTGNKIIFDVLNAQADGGVKFHGGGEYIKALLYFVLSENNHNKEFILCYDKDREIEEWIIQFENDEHIKSVDTKSTKEIVEFVNASATKEKVCFFAGMVYPYASYEFSSNVTAIGTCHGLRMLEKPFDFFALPYYSSKKEIVEWLKYFLLPKKMYRINKNMYTEAISRFQIVITDSEHTKYAIKSLLNDVKTKDIQIVYPLEKHLEGLDTNNRDLLSQGYILMVSANRWLKNARRGILALDSLYSKGLIEIKTRVLGNYPEKLKKEIKNIHCFEFCGYVSNQELEKTYARCEIFFYPTLNEGFGLPPMEAMKYGKTCVISAICSLTEVYGDSVYYFNPYDRIEMQTRLLYALEHKVEIEKIQSRLDYLRKTQSDHMKTLYKIITNESFLD